MKQYFLALAILTCSSINVYAEEDKYATETVNIEDLASRLNVIKPEQRVAIIQPSKESAHRDAQKMTPQEAAILVSVENRISKRHAEQNNEEPPEPISIDVNNKKEVEKLLTPDIYTYDDM